MLRSVPSPVLLPSRLTAAGPTQQQAQAKEPSLSTSAAAQDINYPDSFANQYPKADMQLEPSCLEEEVSADRVVGHQPQQQAALQKPDVQPCRKVLRSLDLFDEAEYFRHKQALKASKHVQDVQQQHLLWQTKSRASIQGDPPAWLQAVSQ